MADEEPQTQVSKALLSEVARGVDRELESRRALNSGLQQLIAFSGILLGAAFALGVRIGEAHIGCTAKTLLTIFFLGAIGGLLGALLIAISALGPQPRTLPNPEVFRFYANERTDDAEMRADLFGVEVDALGELHEGNQRRARRQRLALRILGAPLVLAAAGAATLYFSS